jgi:hypothetical protein
VTTVVVKKLVLILVMSMPVMMFANSDKAYAAGIESLVMPGKLIQGHAKYESECSRCHRPFSKGSQNVLCLDCHEDVSDDVKENKGFHGRTRAGKERCSSCHDDHEGRDAIVVQFSRETFDHEQTDYALKGAHAGTDCVACHAIGKKYRSAEHRCFSCHSTDDIHRENLGEQCDDCHTAQGWRRQDFDHDETDYALHGKHAEVACNSCHVDQQYEDTATECHACHRFNDVHAGRYGAGCADCHREEGWERISFDHDRNTDYPLTGKHLKVACDTCHSDGSFDSELGTDCVSCHRDDDVHRERYGERCDSCHRTSGWEKMVFDHDAKTDFLLRGRHDELLCSACHRGDLDEEELGTQCQDCHKPDDVHAGKLGEQCGSCHNESGWAGQLRFDHDLTNFPLIGLHAVTPCEECHLSALFTDAPGDCNTCHQDDDVHRQRLGPNCEACHNPNAWSLWEFDHDAGTDFRLDGGHQGIDCHACHKQPARRRISLTTSCDGCHRQDDIHDGQFGRHCERCHDTKSFESAEMR